MNNKNICKITTPYVANNLTITNFVFETDKETMKSEAKLLTHRIILVTSEDSIFHFNKDLFHADTGCVIFGFKGESFYADGDAEYIYISFDGIRATDIFNRFRIDKDNRIFNGFQGIIPLWKESLSHASEASIDLAAESILLYTFSKFVMNAITRDSTVDRMIEITNEQFSDPRLSVNVLSGELSYNPKYLSHLFKKVMNIGYAEYLRSIRLKYAISLLDNGIDSIKNVALLSGFADPLYFSTVFKKSMGINPKEYSKSI